MSTVPGSGGLLVPSRMQGIIDRPGYLSVAQGGQTLRELFRQNSITFHSGLLNEFAQACYVGALDAVKTAVEAGTAPNLKGHETAYKYGYASLVLFGSQRVQLQSGDPLDHPGTLKYLLEHGASPDAPDIVGYTALHHACMAYPRADLARILLEHGANPDAQDRFGGVALMGAFQNESVDAIEVLMEFGASLDVVDADQATPGGCYARCGPRVTAVVEKWKRKRAGVAKPLDEKVCAVCRKAPDEPLKLCSKCHATWYCSRECQKKDWSAHKPMCRSSSGAASTVTIRPFYSEEFSALLPAADLTRRALGYPTQEQPSRNTRAVQKPDIPPGQTKKMIIKVQVDLAVPDGDLRIYDKKRTFVCVVRKVDCADGYTQVSQAVRTKGVAGAKAYFSAEMTSPDALVVKVSEVLAEQPF